MSSFDPGEHPRGLQRASWPAVDYETLTWESTVPGFGPVASLRSRGGTYRSALPPEIAGLDVELPSSLLALTDEATTELARFDASLGGEVAPFASLLLRSEAVASSRIENLSASARAILNAELGDTSRRNATVIAGNTKAMLAAVRLAESLTTETVLAMHRELMDGDERHAPGEWREEPVWIGADGSSPVGAVYVAPQADLVTGLMDDVMAFARRTDLPRLAQIAIAHAQFETIHPFTDGNGRTGRALVQAMLRNTGITRNVTVPVSAGLLADTDGYHAALMAYRDGNPVPIVELSAIASFRAIGNARTLVDDIHAIQDGWRLVVKARRGSAAWRILDLIAKQPVVNAEVVAHALGMTVTNVYPALNALVDAGVLQAKSEYNLGRFWRSDELLAALDDFARRAGRRS
ncbi:Fic family protein [Leifsonia sp. NPDC058248]|uniref:Fic family protein n=1 Tax=Leifsonia sp. NPDC058248 TaxID=3346402 RepID=UPI0036D8D90E